MTVVYRFGSFELQPTQRRLLVDGAPVTVGARAFDVLQALAGRAGELVSKQDLLDLAWPGVIVEENNLQVQIGTLRKLLGPDAIVTIPGRGYRLTLEREHAGAPALSTSGQREPDPGSASVSVEADTRSADPKASAERAVEIPALFGRDADIAALKALIREHAVVTVVGPAGIGKTRLARALARLEEGAFVDGVRLVEFAPLVDPAMVAPTVARALGVMMQGEPASLDVALQMLAGQHFLLVLDNCEHLLDAVDEVVSALRRSAPGVRVVATSQELLRHPDEHVYRVGPLQLPEQVSVERARTAGAVQLFLARVQALNPAFDLDAANVAGVVEICRRLDGIPLAIELGATRVPLLGVDGVRRRLDERFRLLTAGSRVALRRHQTLRAALEWSHGLLSVAEQQVFAALGVFPGSFSLESAQALAAGPDMDAWAVLEHLGALVDKSLVAVEGGTDSVPRYRLLETTRALALERLAASGATPATLRRHAEVTLAIFEGAHREVTSGAPSASMIDRLAPELDNLRGALRWASEDGGDDRIAVALFGAAVADQGQFHYFALGAETWRWGEVLRPRVDDSMPAALAARFWLACAQWGGLISPHAAIGDARRAIALYTDLGERLGTAQGWKALAYRLMTVGRRDEAVNAIEEALALRDPQWPSWVLALFDNTAGIVYGQAGDLVKAREHLLAFLAACRTGAAIDLVTATALLVDLDVADGRVQEAAEAASDLLGRSEVLRRRSDDGRVLRGLGTALTLAGRLDQAEEAYREALARARRYYGHGAFVLHEVAIWVARRGRPDEAARISAYTEAVFARESRVPRLVAQRARDQLLAELGARFPAKQLEQLLEEGRRLSDEAACELAFGAMATSR